MATKPKMTVETENFHSTELNCSCGCAKSTHPKMALVLQAFVYVLERVFGTPIRCIIHSGARCKAKHASISEDETSYHLGVTRLDEGPGAAVDCHFEMYTLSEGEQEWIYIDKNIIADLAKASNLFGGVGWKIYPKECKMIHLDIGNKREW
jgi:hypothetical protein